MEFVKSKKGISIIALVGIFVFSIIAFGVFGDTKIGVTIKSNTSLDDGLIGHWTFDGVNIDSASSTAEIQDVSGVGVTGNMINF